MLFRYIGTVCQLLFTFLCLISDPISSTLDFVRWLCGLGLIAIALGSFPVLVARAHGEMLKLRDILPMFLIACPGALLAMQASTWSERILICTTVLLCLSHRGLWLDLRVAKEQEAAKQKALAVLENPAPKGCELEQRISARFALVDLSDLKRIRATSAPGTIALPREVGTRLIDLVAHLIELGNFIYSVCVRMVYGPPSKAVLFFATLVPC